MTSILFYNGTYQQGATLQNINVQDTKNIFGFEYMEDNLNTTLKNCILPKYIQSYIKLDNVEDYVAIHKTCEGVDIGFGLVAVKPIPKNTILFHYLGEDYSEDKNHPANRTGAYITMDVDAEYKGNLARFMTHLPALQPVHEERKAKLANLKEIAIFCKDKKNELFITTSDIESGEEIGWKYENPYYWNNKFLHYIDPNTKKCFPAKNAGQNWEQFLEQARNNYSDEIKKHNDSTTISELYYKRGNANYWLNNYKESFDDYSKSFTQNNQLYLQEKYKYLIAMEETLIADLFINYISKKDGNTDLLTSLTQSINDIRLITTAEPYHTDKINQFAEIFKPYYKTNQCAKEMYDGIINISTILLPYLNIPAGFCTQNQNDNLIFNELHSDAVLIPIMCDVKKNNYYYDPFQNCHSLATPDEFDENFL